MKDDIFKVLLDANKFSVRCRKDADYHRYFTKTPYGYHYDNGQFTHDYQVAYTGPKSQALKVSHTLQVTFRGFRNLSVDSND